MTWIEHPLVKAKSSVTHSPSKIHLEYVKEASCTEQPREGRINCYTPRLYSFTVSPAGELCASQGCKMKSWTLDCFVSQTAANRPDNAAQCYNI